MYSKEYFLKELNEIKEVPTLPQVAFKLIAMISDETSSMRDIGNLIEDDPPLIAKILRIVNSGFYNLRYEVKNIRQAVVILGLEELRDLVFAMSVFSTFYHIKENENFSFLQFWKHCAATGKVATVLCKYIGIIPNHIAFLGGLLHDFGRLVLQLYFRDDYIKVFKFSNDHQISLFDAEKKVLGITHAEAGYWLARRWNLPEDLSVLIRDHHNLTVADVKNNVFLALIHVADRITNIWGISIEPVPIMEVIEENPIWRELSTRYPKLNNFPLEEMTRVFDMHLEEAEIFVEKISAYHEMTKDSEG